MNRGVRQTVVGVALGLTALGPWASASPVTGGPGVLYVGDATAAPASVGPQVVTTLTELGWHWEPERTCWVAPAP